MFIHTFQIFKLCKLKFKWFLFLCNAHPWIKHKITLQVAIFQFTSFQFACQWSKLNLYVERSLHDGIYIAQKKWNIFTKSSQIAPQFARVKRLSCWKCCVFCVKLRHKELKQLHNCWVRTQSGSVNGNVNIQINCANSFPPKNLSFGNIKFKSIAIICNNTQTTAQQQWANFSLLNI